jgi:WD40 repeat protein
MIATVTFSPDGQELLTGSEDATAILWSIDGKKIRELKGHGQTVNSVAFSGDGSTFATGAFDGEARIWRRDKKEAVQTFVKRQSDPREELAMDLNDIIRSVHFTWDDGHIVTNSLGHNSTLWEVRVQRTLADYLTNNADPGKWAPN